MVLWDIQSWYWSQWDKWGQNQRRGWDKLMNRCFTWITAILCLVRKLAIIRVRYREVMYKDMHNSVFMISKNHGNSSNVTIIRVNKLISAYSCSKDYAQWKWINKTCLLWWTLKSILRKQLGYSTMWFFS